MTSATTAASPLPAGVPQSEIADVYRRVASVYDLWALFTETRARRRCVELAAVRDGEALCEVAVGTGLTFSDLAAQNPHGRNVGIDLTPAMLAQAKRRVERLGLRAELAVGDAHQVGFPDGTFDLLVNNYMFDLLPESDFRPVLAEFRRVLKPGGRLVLVNMARGERFWHRAYEKLYQIRPTLMAGCRGVSLLPDVQSEGFTDVRREYLAQCGFPTEIITARRA